MKLKTLNRILARFLTVLIVLFAGVIWGVVATNISGVTNIDISGDLTVTTTLTVNGDEGAHPSNSMILWDSSTCPTGWTKVTTYNNRIPLGSTSAGGTGGSDSHATQHTSTHTHGSASYTQSSTTHDHTATYTSPTSQIDHSHSWQGCGAMGDTAGSDTSYYVHNDIVFSPTYHSHTVSPTSITSGVGGSHTHGESGTLVASGSSSTGGSLLPLYRTLTLCVK